MELNATQNIIVQLKAVKAQQHLTISQIKEKVDATGNIVSETTIRRVFADKSEKDDSFSYESTIRPIAQALLIADGYSDQSELLQAKVASFEAIIKYKGELIESLKKQIDDMRVVQDEKCSECRKRQDFLREQIALKDERMDRKDAIIERLLDELHPPKKKEEKES